MTFEEWWNKEAPLWSAVMSIDMARAAWNAARALPPEGREQEAPFIAAKLAEAEVEKLVWMRQGPIEVYYPQDMLDAARYRWLNKQHNFLIHIENEEQLRNNVRLRCGEPLDKWIDKRIEEERQSPQDERQREKS